MFSWPLPKFFNRLCFKENEMMTDDERWEYENNLDEIVDRLSELFVRMMLMSVKQIDEQLSPLKKRLESEQSNDIPF